MANCRYLQIPFPFLTYISPSVLSMGIVGRKIVTKRTAQFSTFNLPSRKLGEGPEPNEHLPPPITSDSQEWIWICEHKRGYTGFLRALVEFKQRVLLLLLAEPDFIYNVPCTKYYFAATYFFISYRRGLPDRECKDTTFVPLYQI